MTGLLQRVSVLEAISYLVLLGSVVLFRVFDGPRLIGLFGPIHGVIFLVYVWFVLQAHHERDWAWGRTLGLLGAAVIPLGGFYAAERLLDDD